MHVVSVQFDVWELSRPLPDRLEQSRSSLSPGSPGRLVQVVGSLLRAMIASKYLACQTDEIVLRGPQRRQILCISKSGPSLVTDTWGRTHEPAQSASQCVPETPVARAVSHPCHFANQGVMASTFVSSGIINLDLHIHRRCCPATFGSAGDLDDVVTQRGIFGHGHSDIEVCCLAGLDLGLV